MTTTTLANAPGKSTTAKNNKIVLDAALVEELRSYRKNIWENMVALAIKANAIHSQYFDTD
jgi:hypothetical protein